MVFKRILQLNSLVVRRNLVYYYYYIIEFIKIVVFKKDEITANCDRNTPYSISYFSKK